MESHGDDLACQPLAQHCAEGVMDYEGRNITIPTWDGVPQSVAELWRLEKGAKVAVCSLWTHPDGAELRLVIDGKLRSAEASHHTWALSVVALGWKERLHWLQGWR